MSPVLIAMCGMPFSGKSVLWVPAPLAVLAPAMRLIPRPVWRMLKR